MSGEPADKRPRTDVDDLTEEFTFISLCRRGRVTKAQMEAVWFRVFKCKFPRWEMVTEKHLMVRGMTLGPDSKKERICMSFWPISGKWYFQGPDAEKNEHIKRWNAEFDKLYGFE